MGKLLRSNDKIVAGVCAGIAEYFGWSTPVLRLAWLVLAFVGLGSPVLFYLLLWLLMPGTERNSDSYEERMKKRLGK